MLSLGAILPTTDSGRGSLLALSLTVVLFLSLLMLTTVPSCLSVPALELVPAFELALAGFIVEALLLLTWLLPESECLDVGAPLTTVMGFSCPIPRTSVCRETLDPETWLAAGATLGAFDAALGALDAALGALDAALGALDAALGALDAT